MAKICPRPPIGALYLTASSPDVGHSRESANLLTDFCTHNRRSKVNRDTFNVLALWPLRITKDCLILP